MGVPGKGGVYFLELLDQSQILLYSYECIWICTLTIYSDTMIKRTTMLLEPLTVHMPESF